MAGNAELIDSVIDPAAIKQVTDLTTSLEGLQLQLLDNIKAALQLNGITATSSTSFSKFESNSSKSSIAISKVTEANNKAAIAATNLEKAQATLAAQEARTEKAQASAKVAQERSTEAAKKALSPYAQLSKELERLRSHAKDVGVEFGENSKEFKAAAKPVQELDEKFKRIDKTLGQSQRNVGNYGNAFKGVINQYIPFGESTVKVSENLKTLGIDLEESAGELSGLAAGFAGFAIGGFIIAISSAISYLSQFKSTSNEIEADAAGLKNVFNSFGGKIVESTAVDKIKKFFSEGFKHTLIGAETTGSEDFKKGYDAEKQKQALERNDELTKANNDELKVESEKNRALSSDRKLDISDRISHLKDAQKIEGEILENQKNNSEKTFQTAIAIGTKLGTLRKDQIKLLKEGFEKGDLKPGQDLASFGRTLTPEAFELYKKAIEKRVAYLQGANNQIIQLQADADNLELRADRALAQAQFELDKARLEGQLTKSKLIIDSDKSSYQERISANEDFVNKSLALADKEKNNSLGAAGLGGKGGADKRLEKIQRLKIEQDYQNQVDKIATEGYNNTQKIQKQVSDELKKELEDIISSNSDAEKLAIQGLQEFNDSQLTKIQAQSDKELYIVATKYQKRKISEKQYQKEITQIQDQANVDRLAQEAFNAQSILQVRQAAENAAISNLQGQGGQDAIDKIKANSGVAGAQNTLDKAGLALQSGLNTQAQNNAKLNPDETKNREIFAIESAQKLEEDGLKIINSHYEYQLSLLEKKSKLIDENATIEKAAIQRSLDTNANKARRESVLDSQTASAHKAIMDQENKLKKRQAQFEKANAIAQIIQNTAIAAIKAPAELGPILGALAVPIVLALGAAQLATVLATKIPAFEKGGTTQGGGLIWGEKGTELAIEPGGKSYFSPDRATFTTMPAGTKIIPNDQLIKPKSMNGYTSTSTDKAVVNAINNNTLTLKKAFQSQRAPRVNVYVDNDFANYSKRINR